MGFKGFDRMKKTMDKIQNLQDKATTSEDYDKAWENVKKDPKSAPKFIDGMPPKKDEDKNKIINKPSSEVKKFDENYKKGGKVSSASKRADGCAIKGKTKGKIV